MFFSFLCLLIINASGLRYNRRRQERDTNCLSSSDACTSRSIGKMYDSEGRKTQSHLFSNISSIDKNDDNDFLSIVIISGGMKREIKDLNKQTSSFYHLTSVPRIIIEKGHERKDGGIVLVLRRDYIFYRTNCYLLLKIYIYFCREIMKK